MLGQKYYGFYLGSENYGVAHAWDIQVDPPAKVLTEVALTRVNDLGGDLGFFSRIGILEIVSSQGGIETFDPYLRQAILRQGVSLVRIQIDLDNSYTRGRVLLNFW